MPDPLIFPGFIIHVAVQSARVMRDENGGSRGFGFVSYHEPEHGKIYLIYSICKSPFVLKLLRLCVL